MINISMSRLFLITSLSILLAACGGSGDGDGDGGGTGTLNLNVTDAPIDFAEAVWVTFSGVTVKPSGGPARDIDFGKDSEGNSIEKQINLMALTGDISETLLDNEILDAGHYNWLRLKVVANDSPADTDMDSHIVLLGGETRPLYIPSGDQTGLKLNRGFDIPDGGVASFTIDFDLRKSIVAPADPTDLIAAYKLRPTLRIVDTAGMGHISGAVGDASRADAACTATDYAVYVYSGPDLDIATLDDEGGVGGNPLKDPFDVPVTTALVPNDGAYNYTVGFLEAGDYTLAFTCDAKADTSSEIDDVLVFSSTINATVTAGTVTPDQDFP